MKYCNEHVDSTHATWSGWVMNFPRISSYRQSGWGARTPCQHSTPRSKSAALLTDSVQIFVTNVQSDTREQPTSLWASSTGVGKSWEVVDGVHLAQKCDQLRALVHWEQIFGLHDIRWFLEHKYYYWCLKIRLPSSWLLATTANKQLSSSLVRRSKWHCIFQDCRYIAIFVTLIWYEAKVGSREVNFGAAFSRSFK